MLSVVLSSIQILEQLTLVTSAETELLLSSPGADEIQRIFTRICELLERRLVLAGDNWGSGNGATEVEGAGGTMPLRTKLRAALGDKKFILAYNRFLAPKQVLPSSSDTLLILRYCGKMIAK